MYSSAAFDVRRINWNDKQLHARAQAVLGRYYAKVGDSDVASHHYTHTRCNE